MTLQNITRRKIWTELNKNKNHIQRLTNLEDSATQESTTQLLSLNNRFGIDVTYFIILFFKKLILETRELKLPS